MLLKESFSLKSYNTFGIDVVAKYFSQFSTISELSSLLNNKIVQKENKLILGGGSNILFTDDFNGVVLLNKIKGIEIVREDQNFAYVKAGAGEIWHDLVLYCIEKDLGGIENLSLIPGTVGAAPIQNIGAYGVELQDAFDCLEAFCIETQQIETFCAPDCCFGYRNSIFKNQLKGKYVITSLTLKLSKNHHFKTSYGAISTTIAELGYHSLSLKSISEAVIAIRKSKLPDPLELGNAGSFFKNPEITREHFERLKTTFPDIPSFPGSNDLIKIPAGWLNEHCGWKGKVVGKTGIHKLQALVLVNYGGAKGTEIKQLSEDIKKSVFDKFGIKLETEVNII